MTDAKQLLNDEDLEKVVGGSGKVTFYSYVNEDGILIHIARGSVNIAGLIDRFRDRTYMPASALSDKEKDLSWEAQLAEWKKAGVEVVEVAPPKA